MITIIIYLGVSMFLLWFLIERLSGTRPDNWLELFIVCAVMSLVGALNNLILIFSQKPAAIFGAIIVSIIIANVILFLYLEFRYGIGDKRRIIYIMLAFFIGRFVIGRFFGLPIY